MNNVRSLVWLSLAFFPGLLACPISGQTAAKNQRPAANVACLECHKDTTLQSSAHESLACTDCHAGLVRQPTGVAHQKKSDIPAVDCTKTCHRENHYARPGQSPVYYPDSVHGKAYLERGIQDVAKCWDCHGKHNIKKIEDPNSTVNRRNIPLTCSRCHENMTVVLKYNIHAEFPYQEYMQSVHGKALFEKGLVSFAAVCTDCHGVHNIQGVGEPNLQARQPETCGRCHVLILDEYKNSVHGSEAMKGNPDVPLCVDCHGEHKVEPVREAGAKTSKVRIPDTCSECHAKPEIMKKYGVPQDRIQTFIESFHGIAIGFGDKAEASCTDCHGVHNIRPANDPQSTVNAANLAKTCGRPGCHPGMPARIASAKIHLDINAKKSGPPYYVQKALIWILLLVIVVTAALFFPVLLRLIKRRKNS
jgi:ribosomal protein S27E